MAIGSHRLEYDVVQGWERLPEGWAFTEVVGVAVDSGERVFVFCRGAHPLIVFDKDGRFVDAWGAGAFVRPHGIFISPDDRVFLVDDEGHTVYEYTTQGPSAAGSATAGRRTRATSPGGRRSRVARRRSTR